jgi:hypothetical protein
VALIPLFATKEIKKDTKFCPLYNFSIVTSEYFFFEYIPVRVVGTSHRTDCECRTVEEEMCRVLVDIIRICTTSNTSSSSADCVFHGQHRACGMTVPVSLRLLCTVSNTRQ